MPGFASPVPLGLSKAPEIDSGTMCRSWAMPGSIQSAQSLFRTAAARPAAFVLSAEAMHAVFPAAALVYLQQVARAITETPRQGGLGSLQRVAHFLAQLREECGPTLQRSTENLNYRASVLVSKFGYYKKHPDEASEDGSHRDLKTNRVTESADPEAIANKAYAGRMGNGDVASGDGWRYRGRGFIQLTGRANYRAAAIRYASIYGSGVDFEQDPDQVAVFPYSLRSAVCFWSQHGLHNLADLGTTGAHVDSITAVINKKTDSYARRRGHFEVALWALRGPSR